jgi:hypothetical protein
MAMITVPIMSMAMFVIFAIPVALVVAPTFSIMVIVWMRPICAPVGWLFVASGNPTIVMSLRSPKAAYPDHPHGRRRWGWRFKRYRRGGDSDIHGNLSRRGYGEGNPEKKPN